jgi:hypothetical protein
MPSQRAELTNALHEEIETHRRNLRFATQLESDELARKITERIERELHLEMGPENADDPRHAGRYRMITT